MFTLQQWDTKHMQAQKSRTEYAAYVDLNERQILKDNVAELQTQLQKAYIRIKELTEQVDTLSKS
jgi:hypothetical protein